MRAPFAGLLFVSLLLLGCVAGGGQPTAMAATPSPIGVQGTPIPSAAAAGASPSPEANLSALLNATPCIGGQNFSAPFGGPMCVGDAVKFKNQTVTLTFLNATTAKFEASRIGWDGKPEVKDRASLVEFASKRLWAMEAGTDIGIDVQTNVNRIYLDENGNIAVDASITPEYYVGKPVYGCADFIVTYQTKPYRLYTKAGYLNLTPYIKIILVHTPMVLLFGDNTPGMEAYVEPDGKHYWYYSNKALENVRADMPFNFNSLNAVETVELKLLDNATLPTGPGSRVILTKTILMESNTPGMFLAGDPPVEADKIYFETLGGRDVFWTVWYQTADGYYHSARNAYADLYCESK